jgi:hypothetical protein
MAANGPLAGIDAPTAALWSSAVTAVLAWLGNRLVGQAAIKTAVATTFEKQIAGYDSLLDQYKSALHEALGQRDEARAEALTLHAEIRQKDAIIAGFERTTIAPHGKDPA